VATAHRHASDSNPLTYASSVARITGTHHHTWLIEMGVSIMFCPGWPQTSILLISASRRVGFMGVYHPGKPGEASFKKEGSDSRTLRCECEAILKQKI
jgi:hypothetical protein